MYFGVAKNDDERQPDAKDKLKAAMAAAKVPAEIEVYPSQHGWCMSDFTAPPTPIYDKPQAERAWGKLLALYKAGLAWQKTQACRVAETPSCMGGLR